MKENIECAGKDGICLFCEIGDDLENDEQCEYINLLNQDGCPKFICVERCRLCPPDCEFYL